jgi:hypothetical protein
MTKYVFEPDERHPLWNNVRWGIGWGLRIVAVFSIAAVVVIAIRLLTGALTPIGALKLLMFTACLYLFGAVVAGGITGLLRNQTETWLGAVVVGFLAMFPVALAGLLSLAGVSRFGVPIVAASAAIAGIWSMIAVSKLKGY